MPDITKLNAIVQMMGCALNFPMTTPLTMPSTVPDTRPSSMLGTKPNLIALTDIMPAKAMVIGRLISLKLAEMTMKLIPMADIPSSDTACTTDLMLSSVKNLPGATAAPITASSITIR